MCIYLVHINLRLRLSWFPPRQSPPTLSSSTYPSPPSPSSRKRHIFKCIYIYKYIFYIQNLATACEKNGRAWILCIRDIFLSCLIACMWSSFVQKSYWSLSFDSYQAILDCFLLAVKAFLLLANFILILVNCTPRRLVMVLPSWLARGLDTPALLFGILISNFCLWMMNLVLLGFERQVRYNWITFELQ